MSGSISDLVQAQRSGNLLDAIAHPAQVNLLGAYNAAADTAGKMWDIRKLQAAQAAGEAQLSGIDANGLYQPNVAATALKNAGPGAALAAGPTLESSERLGTSSTARGIATSRLIASAVAPLIDPTLTPDAQFHQGVSDVAQQLIARGVPAAQVIGGLTHLSNDPTQARRQLEVMRQGMLPPDQLEQNIYGRPGTQTGQGGETIGTRQNTRTGAVTPAQPAGTGAALGLPPSGPVKLGQTAAGLDIMGTPQQGKNVAEGRDMNDNGPASPTASPLGTGRLPPAALRNPNKPAPPAAAPTAPPGVTPLPGGGYTTGQSTAQQTAQTATGTGSASRFNAYADQDVAAQSQVALLGNMLGDAAQFATGPGAQGVKTFKQVLTSWTPKIAQSFGINPESVSAQESFDKLAAQIVSTQQGAQTDSRMQVQEAGSPHSGLTPQGVDLIIRQLQGNADYIRARAKLAAGYPDKTDHAAFQASISDLDPRAFQFSRMTGPQRRTYITTLSGDDKRAVENAYNWAHDKGLVGG